MQTIKLTYPHSLDNQPQSAAAIGFFDGIHKGHQEVIQTAMEQAKTKGIKSAVISFDPHPSLVFNPEIDHVDYLTPLDEKETILNEMGVDLFYIITFNKQLSKLSPQAFIDHFIIGLNIKHLVAGFDFTYGHKGSGNVATLRDHSKGAFNYTVLDKVEADGEKISSTRIRQLFSESNVQKAGQLLGRTPSVRGKVVEGFKRGRTLGYPTANIVVSPETRLPAPGVYAVKAGHGKDIYNGMASLGFNPTFESSLDKPSLEVYLFDFTGDLYGHHITLKWCKFIRPEMKFEQVEDLIHEMQQDEQIIKQYFAANDG